MNRSLRFAVLALSLVALSGCGDSDEQPKNSTPTAPTTAGASGSTGSVAPSGATSAPVTKPLSSASKQFARKLDAACRKYDTSEAEVYYADAVASGGDPKADLDEMLRNYKALLRAAQTFDPPADSQQDFDAYLDSLRALVKQPDPLTAALEARNETAIKLGAENCIMDSAD